jgi:hypothetical protein
MAIIPREARHIATQSNRDSDTTFSLTNIFTLYTSYLKNALRLLALSNASVNAAQHPDTRKKSKHAECDNDRLPVASSPWVVVSDNQVTVPEVIDKVDSCQAEGRASERVHESPVQACRVVYNWCSGLELDIRGALWKNDAKVYATVRDALRHTRSLEEGDLESIGLASGKLAQVVG